MRLPSRHWLDSGLNLRRFGSTDTSPPQPARTEIFYVKRDFPFKYLQYKKTCTSDLIQLKMCGLWDTVKPAQYKPCLLWPPSKLIPLLMPLIHKIILIVTHLISPPVQWDHFAQSIQWSYWAGLTVDKIVTYHKRMQHVLHSAGFCLILTPHMIQTHQ